MIKALEALSAITAHERVCVERWNQIRSQIGEISLKLDQLIVIRHQQAGAGKVAGWVAKAGWGGLGAAVTAGAAKFLGFIR